MKFREAVARWLGLREAVEDAWVDRRDAYLGDHGETWLPIGAAAHEEQQKSGFMNEAELAEARGICRYLARKSAYAIGAHQARVSYVVGTGHKYTVVSKKGRQLSPELLAAFQALLDEWLYRERWHRRQQEMVLRRDRDGEVFLRKFVSAEGSPVVRFVEPGQVANPANASLRGGPFQNSAAQNGRGLNGSVPRTDVGMGIETEPGDVEHVLRYWIDGELVDAADVQHRKGQVDSNVRRGSPLFWSVVETLGDARKVNKHMARGAALQTSVAYVRRVGGATSGAATTLRATAAGYTRTNPVSGKVEYLEQHQSGRILTVPENVDYEFPFAGTRYDQYVQVVQSNLREVAAMLQMPEFMLTADASNANYASTLVAEGPAVKNFERLQADQECDDLEILWWAVGVWVSRGLLSESVLENAEIQVSRPALTVRDKLQEAQVVELLRVLGLMSPQTACAQFGLDYAQEQENMRTGGRLEAGGRSEEDATGNVAGDGREE